MRTLIRMMKIFLGPHKVGVALSLVLALATTGMGMFVPWLTKLAVDRALVPQRGDLVTVFAAAIVGVGLLRMVFAFCRRIVSGRVALAVETEVRNRLFDHLQTLGLDFHLRSQTGQLMSRAIADVRAVRMFLGYGLIFVMTNVATLVGVTVILLLLQPRLAIMSLAPLPLILVVARAFSKRLHPSLWAIQQRVAELTAVAEERIMGIGVIKAFAIEHLQAEAFEAASDRIYRQNLEAAAIKGRYVPLLGMLPSISLMIILFYGGRAVIADQMTLGSLVAFNGYVMLLIWPMRMLGMLVSWGERAVASGERVLEILEESPTVRDSPRASALAAVRGVLEFDDVSFEYGGRRVIDGVTVRIERGETVALVGPTGCGKTTLAHLIPRFHDPARGTVKLDGHDLRDITLSSLRGSIGLVDQDPFLFSLPVIENIRYGVPDASLERVEQAARAAAAHDFIQALPKGYDTTIGERGLTLSGGQRQRVALARALLTDPAILILDDATSSVDAETESRIVAAIGGLRGTRTTVIIAHRPSTVMLADRVILMEHGKISQIGPPCDVPWEEILVREAEESLQRGIAAAPRARASEEEQA
ncbi:MAG TPA: ABC transporter ATP-binding protein [Thermoleophilia bacterium]|nr:ABC transporter ATP-binding protein [Thermoleophilia bacterium]